MAPTRVRGSREGRESQTDRQPGKLKACGSAAIDRRSEGEKEGAKGEMGRHKERGDVAALI